MAKKMFLMVFFLVFISGIAVTAYATTYYVSTTGNDNNNGLTPATPFCTIQKAATKAVAGDNIEIQAGIYYQRVFISISGAENNYITYHGNGTVILDGRNGKNQYCIRLYGADYIKIQGITCRNSSVDGILLENGATHNIITENICHANQITGIKVTGGSAYNVISYNILYDNRLTGYDVKLRASVGGYMTPTSGLELSGAANNNLIKNNTIYKNGTYGIRLNSASSQNVIKNNIVSGQSVSGIYVEKSPQPIVSYNDLYKNGFGGTRNYFGVSPGIGDISLDPFFKSTDFANSNFLKLQSNQLGDAQNSPCIDTGDPADTTNPKSLPRIDMGAYDLYTNSPIKTAAYWRLDEGAGATAYDGSPYHNDATINRALWTAGLSNTALYFNGADSFASVEDNASLAVTDTVTVEAWIKIDGLNSPANCIISKHNSFWFYVHETGNVVFEEGLHWEGIWSNSRLQPNIWYHVVGVWDKINNKKQIFINGRLDNEAILTYAFSISNHPLGIGCYSCEGWQTHYFKGIIDEVKIYNSALTAKEILQEYNLLKDNTISIDGYFGEWTEERLLGTDLSGDVSEGDFVDWEKLWAADKDNIIYLSYQASAAVDFVSKAWQYGIYIDADNNRSTGFIGCGGGYKIGAEYMIAGALLHRYTGDGTSWNWEFVSLLNYAAVDNKVEMAVTESCLGLSGNYTLQIMLCGSNPTTIDYGKDDMSGFEYNKVCEE